MGIPLRHILIFSTVILTVLGGHSPPALPLIVNSPYISVWAPDASLTDKTTMHWTGIETQIAVLVKVDGNAFRILGPHPSGTPALPRKSVKVNPTQTIAVFGSDVGVDIVLKFTTPAIATNVTLLSLPITYIDLTAIVTDGKSHIISGYIDISEQFCLGKQPAPLKSCQFDTPSLRVLGMGAKNQAPLSTSGDWVAIDWGYAYLGSPAEHLINASYGNLDAQRSHFVGNINMQHNGDLTGISFTVDLGAVSEAPVSRHVTFAYDEIAIIDFFGEVLTPRWKQTYSVSTLMEMAGSYHDSIVQECREFDDDLIEKLSVNGADFEYLASLVYRQVTGSISMSNDMIFMKEISSDGDINTVDVVFPASPFFAYLAPSLLYEMLIPILKYANNETNIKYNLTWAPHHLGVWPIADCKPMKQEQMPDEETANMLLMLAVICQSEGTTSFLSHYTQLLEQWADYLVDNGLDPGDQLCSDDFMGPSAHNANLAVKSIVGLGAYSVILKIDGKIEKSEKFMRIAMDYAQKWAILDADGDHYALQYNLSNTWSLKYNMLWQDILGISLFPDTVINEELAYYLKKSTKFGPALDIRKPWAKLDWSSWSGAMGDNGYFQHVMSELVAFTDQSLTGWPVADLFDTVTGLPLLFRARPVVGAIYAKLLLKS